jgi:hypothetical protein
MGRVQRLHKGSTCAARVTHTRQWYDLTGHRRGALFWPMSQQYKHAVPLNEHSLIANHNLFDILPHDIERTLLAGILNSSFVVLSKFLYGRPVGNEGNLKTEVIDVTMMPVPDPRGSNSDALLRVSSAFEKMKERSALQFLSERRMRRMAYTKAGRDASFRTSRIFLNSTWTTAVLSTTRSSKCSAWVMRARKALLDGLYDHLREFFENGRQKEELAISNKSRSKRKAALSPNEIAGQILAEVKSGQGHLLRAFRDFVDANKPTTALDLPASGLVKVHEDIFARDGSVRFLKGRKQIALVPTKNRKQAALVALIALRGMRGLIRIPLNAGDCVEVRKPYEKFVADRDKQLRAMVADRTGDPDLQEEVFASLADLIQHEANL